MNDNPNPAGGATGAAAPLVADGARVVTLASGRSIELTEGAEDRIRVRSTDGEVVLTVRLTAEGPVVSLSGASLEIAASKNLAISCETLQIKVKSDVSLEVGGSLRERVAGSAVREAAGASTIAAREVKLDAFPGGVVVEANDDVSIKGERVRLNSDDPPMPLTWEEHRARRALAAGKPEVEDLMADILRGALPPGADR